VLRGFVKGFAREKDAEMVLGNILAQAKIFNLCIIMKEGKRKCLKNVLQFRLETVFQRVENLLQRVDVLDVKEFSRRKWGNESERSGLNLTVMNR